MIKTHQLLKQSTLVSPQQIQDMRILQMTGHELAEYIFQQATDNPVIDMDRLHESSILDRQEWRSKADYTNTRHTVQAAHEESESFRQEFPYAPAEMLKEHLLFQLSGCKLSLQEERIARWLIDCVDEKGYLSEAPESVSARFECQVETVERVLALLRSFTPVGVCAENFKQCLIAQTNDLPDRQLVCTLIDQYMDDIARGYFPHIASTLGVSVERVNRAVSCIKKLSPIPATGFCEIRDTVYVIPDLQVECIENELKVSLLNSFQPYLQINSYYFDLYQNSSDPDLVYYLGCKFKAIESLVRSLHKRESILVMCAEKIVQIQKDYFLERSQMLFPISISEFAESLGLSVSTVSRAIREKYIHCSRGTIALRGLFTRGSCPPSDVTVPQFEVQNLLCSIIQGEDPKNPYSDEQISKELESMGIFLSRRAVAAHREKLHIPSSYARKRRN